jgi:hypothetical protein
MQAPFPQDAAPAHPAAEPPPEAEARVSAPPPPAAAPVTRAPAPAARAPVAARTPPERAPQRQEAPLAYGTLRIESGSPVVIEIDGRPYGPTPLSGLRLPRGEHRVIAHYADGSVAQKTITLDEEDVSIFYR